MISPIRMIDLQRSFDSLLGKMAAGWRPDGL
jgi:hypothetical protein